MQLQKISPRKKQITSVTKAVVEWKQPLRGERGLKAWGMLQARAFRTSKDPGRTKSTRISFKMHLALLRTAYSSYGPSSCWIVPPATQSVCSASIKNSSQYAQQLSTCIRGLLDLGIGHLDEKGKLK